MRLPWLQRYWLRLWLVLLVMLLAGAPLKRHLDLQGLGRRLTAQLTPAAEHGYPAGSGWGDELQGYLWDYPASPAQGPAIYLLVRGYCDPALLRVLLLSEAQRPRDWAYTYTRVRNHDLRSGLIRRCLAAYPDDLKVAWAAGVLQLAAGEDEAALQQLQRIIDALGTGDRLDAFAADQGIAPQHLLGRYCAALTLCGRDSAVETLLEQAAQSGSSFAVQYCYLNWLYDHGQHRRVLELLQAQPQPPVDGDWNWRLYTGSLFWSGDIAGYRAALGSADADPLDLRAAQLGALYENWARPEEQALKDWARAELSAATADPRWLSPLLQRWRDLRASRLHALTSAAVAQLDEAAQGAYFRWRDGFAACGMALVHALVLRAEWERAAAVLHDVDWVMGEHSSLAGSYLGDRVLVALANGQPLAGPDQTAAPPPAGFGGSLAALREKDGLTRLLRSQQFAAALSAGRRSLDSVIADLRPATQPERTSYWDYSNGELPPDLL